MYSKKFFFLTSIHFSFQNLPANKAMQQKIEALILKQVKLNEKKRIKENKPL